MNLNTLPLPRDPVQPCALALERLRGWVPIRTLAQRHRPRVLAHLLALDDEDRVWRFGHAVSDDRLRRYAAQLDFDRDQVFGCFDRRLTLVALGHLALDPAQGSGELGLSVLHQARGRGLGGRLFEHAVTHARNRSVHTLVVHLARDNRAMLAIVQRAGAQIEFDAGEARATLALEPDTLGSQIDELLSHQAAELDFRLKMQTLRVDLVTGLRDEAAAAQI